MYDGAPPDRRLQGWAVQMKKRDYKHEYQTYQGTEEQKKNRAARNKVRREAIRVHGKEALKGKDVGHKVALDSGGSTSKSNTRLQGVKSNRGWRKGESGYKVPKA
jgi:hypothetical protein